MWFHKGKVISLEQETDHKFKSAKYCNIIFTNFEQKFQVDFCTYTSAYQQTSSMVYNKHQNDPVTYNIINITIYLKPSKSYFFILSFGCVILSS